MNQRHDSFAAGTFSRGSLREKPSPLHVGWRVRVPDRPGSAAMALLLSAGLLLLSSCGSRTEQAPVSDREARSVLDDIVAISVTGDLGEHCPEFRASMCDEFFQSAGPVGPPGPLTVVGSVEVPLDSRNDTPGRLLVVCGERPDGERFQTGFLVYRADSGGYIVPYPVYWSGVGVTLLEPGETATTARPEDDPPLGECLEAGAFD
ncbi:MAG: hypothetical protein ACE5EF_03455 [Dehalococcoidia bacterium]